MKKIQTILYWLISCTWGIVMTLFGAIVGVFSLIRGHKPCRYKQAIYFQDFGKNWGGFEAGAFFFTDENTTSRLCAHEWGHSLQNLVLGPFMPLIVSIPSCIRYWLREQRTIKNKYKFAIILIVSLLLVPTILLLLGYLLNHNQVILIVGYSLLTYIALVGYWLIFVETPKYKEGKGPAYDDIWFEGLATRLGEKYYKPGDYKPCKVKF